MESGAHPDRAGDLLALGASPANRRGTSPPAPALSPVGRRMSRLHRYRCLSEPIRLLHRAVLMIDRQDNISAISQAANAITGPLLRPGRTSGADINRVDATPASTLLVLGPRTHAGRTGGNNRPGLGPGPYPCGPSRHRPHPSCPARDPRPCTHSPPSDVVGEWRVVVANELLELPRPRTGMVRVRVGAAAGRFGER